MAKTWIFKKQYENDAPFDVDALKDEIRKAFDYIPVRFLSRDMFALKSDFTDWVLENRKTTTIRYKKNALDIPKDLKLKVVRTGHFERNYKGKRVSLEFRIVAFGIKKFEDLTELDATNDGFENLAEARTVLREIYPDLKDQSIVSIYTIEPV